MKLGLNSKTFLSGLAIVAVLLIISNFVYKSFVLNTASAQHKGEAKLVAVARAKLSSIMRHERFIGTVESKQFAVIASKVKGVLEMRATPCAHVQKGQIIAIIHDKDGNQHYNYDAAKRLAAIAEAQYERASKLFSLKVMSAAILEEKHSTMLASAKTLKQAQNAVEELNIRAPFDGMLGAFKLREGAEVKSGDVITNCYNPQSLSIRFDVPSSVLPEINDSSFAVIDKKRYKLTHFQNMVDNETNMCPVYVNIDSEEHKHTCIVGSSVDVLLVLTNKEHVLTVPYAAVFIKAGKTCVYIVKDNQINIAEVVLGVREKNLVEITSGVAVDDLVVVKGQESMYPTMPVQAIEAKTS